MGLALRFCFDSVICLIVQTVLRPSPPWEVTLWAQQIYGKREFYEKFIVKFAFVI